MPLRRPVVVGTFPGAEDLDVSGAGRIRLRAPEVVVVATEPTQALVATWAARLATDPQPLAEARGPDLVDLLRPHEGRRTVLWVVAPPAPMGPVGVAVLERVAALLAEQPDLLAPDECADVLAEVVRRLSDDDGGGVALPASTAERLVAEHTALEEYLASNRVHVRGDRALLRPRTPAAPADPATVLEATAATVAGLLQDLRGEVRRRTGRAADPDAVVRRG